MQPENFAPPNYEKGILMNALKLYCHFVKFKIF